MAQNTRPEGPQAEPSEQTLADVMAMMAGRFVVHPGDRQRVEKAFRLAERLQREARAEGKEGESVSDRDLAGYAVSRLATDLRAHLTIREAEAARLSALGLALLVRPNAMLKADFAPVCTAPVREVLRYVDAQYVVWHREVSKPLRDMTLNPGFRAGALRVFERVDRHEPGVLAAEYRRIARFVQARGRVCTPEEVEGALFQQVEKHGPEGVVREVDGGIRLRERKCRDLVESLFPMSAAEVPEGAVEPDPLSDAPERLDRADRLAQLLEQCDSIDEFILGHWQDGDAEIGRALERSGQGIGKRRRTIRERAQRLGLTLP